MNYCASERKLMKIEIRRFLAPEKFPPPALNLSHRRVDTCRNWLMIRDFHLVHHPKTWFSYLRNRSLIPIRFWLIDFVLSQLENIRDEKIKFFPSPNFKVRLDICWRNFSSLHSSSHPAIINLSRSSVLIRLSTQHAHTISMQTFINLFPYSISLELKSDFIVLQACSAGGKITREGNWYSPRRAVSCVNDFKWNV